MDKKFTKEEMDAIVAAAVAAAKARRDQEKAVAVAAAVAAVEARCEARFEQEMAVATARIKYEFFMKERATMRQMTIKSCRYTEFVFVPPPPGT
jgi:hypothetical protein